MDIEYLLWLQNFRNGFLDWFLMAVTDFVVSPVMYAFVAILYWCFNKKAASFLAMNLSFGSMVNQALKNTFCIYRPWVKHPEIKPLDAAKESATGYSIPSGHTQVASSEFLSIAVWQKKKKRIVAFCVFMTFLVMFTRNYLGVHTPQDVLASLFVSVAVIAINKRLFEWIDKGENRDLVVFFSGIVVALLFLLYTTLKPYPMDYTENGVLLQNPKEMIVDCYVAAGCVLGFLCGWIAERRFIKFTTEVSNGCKIARGAVGAVILVVAAVFLREPVTKIDIYWGEFIFFFLAFLFIMALYPAVFTAVEKKLVRKRNNDGV